MSKAGEALAGKYVMEINPPQVPHLEDYFQHEEHNFLVPTTQNLFSLDNGVLLLVMAKLLKTNPVLFRDLVAKYLDSCTKIVCSIMDSCHGSSATTVIINNTTVACVLHRIGLIDDGGYEKIVDQNRNIFDKEFWRTGAEAALTGITTLVQGDKNDHHYHKGAATKRVRSAADIAALVSGKLA